jgi:hypothetical protein
LFLQRLGLCAAAGGRRCSRAGKRANDLDHRGWTYQMTLSWIF